MSNGTPFSDPLTVTDVAKLSALTWLHEVQEHEGLMRQSIAQWPAKTFQLAVHIQCAIAEGQQKAFRAGLTHAVQAAEEKRLYWEQHMAGGSTATVALCQLRERLKIEAASSIESRLGSCATRRNRPGCPIKV